MYDWGNYWAKGIKCRTRVRDDIPYAGFFTQLGKIHTIYHMWYVGNSIFKAIDLDVESVLI
jgi:hypothetical protein